MNGNAPAQGSEKPRKERYYALIGDVVGSRRLENRAELQRTLQRILESLNAGLSDRGASVKEIGTEGAGGAARRHEGFAAPLKLTAGDEIQGLLLDPAPAVDIVVAIADALHPAGVVWGLGAGALSTDLGPDVAVLDGPCFHRARAAVRRADDDGVWLRAKGFSAPHEDALSALFRVMGAVRSRWKPAQLRYIRGARGHLQKEVAEMHDVDESTVSKALQAARFRDVEEGEAAARALLRWMAATSPEPDPSHTNAGGAR